MYFFTRNSNRTLTYPLANLTRREVSRKLPGKDLQASSSESLPIPWDQDGGSHTRVADPRKLTMRCVSRSNQTGEHCVK